MLLTTSLRRTPRSSWTLAQSLALLVVPHGGQRHARHNAWASMSADAATSHGRRQAQTALATPHERPHTRTLLRTDTGT